MFLVGCANLPSRNQKSSYVEPFDDSPPVKIDPAHHNKQLQVLDTRHSHNISEKDNTSRLQQPVDRIQPKTQPYRLQPYTSKSHRHNEVHVYPYNTSPSIVVDSASIDTPSNKSQSSNASTSSKTPNNASPSIDFANTPSISYTDTANTVSPHNPDIATPDVGVETDTYVDTDSTDNTNNESNSNRHDTNDPEYSHDTNTVESPNNVQHQENIQTIDKNSAIPQQTAPKSVTPITKPPATKRPPRPPLKLAHIIKPKPFFVKGLAKRPPVQALLKQAAKQRKAGNLVKAAAILERSLRIEARNPYLWNRLARIRFEQGLFSQANTLAAKSNTLARGDKELIKENKHIISEAQKRDGNR